jgi:hypothetical protein
MMLFIYFTVLSCAYSLIDARHASKEATIHSPSPASDAGVFQVLGRALSLVKRDSVFMNSTVLDKGFNGDVLFS